MDKNEQDNPLNLPKLQPEDISTFKSFIKNIKFFGKSRGPVVNSCQLNEELLKGGVSKFTRPNTDEPE